MTFTIEPIVPKPEQSGVDFGAMIHDLDLDKLTGKKHYRSVRHDKDNQHFYTMIDEDFKKLEEAVYTYQVVVVRNQSHVSPKTQYEITKRFEPEVDTYGHGGQHRAEQSVIARDLSPFPDVPQVQLLGHGTVRNYQGIEERKLTHPHHKVFHRDVLSQEDQDAGKTRFYRWHMDAALYKLNPPKVTSLFGFKNPVSIMHDDAFSATTKLNDPIRSLDVKLLSMMMALVIHLMSNWVLQLVS